MDTTQTHKPMNRGGVLVLKTHQGCGGMLKGTTLNVGTGTIALTCETCGAKEEDKLNKREQFQTKWDSGFFQKRKNWAWHTLRRAGVTEPGIEIAAEFRGVYYSLRIGPRGGTRIRECAQ